MQPLRMQPLFIFCCVCMDGYPSSLRFLTGRSSPSPCNTASILVCTSAWRLRQQTSSVIHVKCSHYSFRSHLCDEWRCKAIFEERDGAQWPFRSIRDLIAMLFCQAHSPPVDACSWPRLTAILCLAGSLLSLELTESWTVCTISSAQANKSHWTMQVRVVVLFQREEDVAQRDDDQPNV
jgi:hypothetical protein